MKKIIFFILLFIANYTYSQVKVDASGGIIPTGVYPAVDGNDVKGSVHEVQSIIDRDNIPANFRRLGMLAYVVDSLRYYQLKTGLTNNDWYELRWPDTTHVELPLYVDTANGVRTLKILHDDGLISGGIVTKGVADWDLDVTNAVYYIGHKAYSSSSSTVAIDTADATYDRIDRIAVDTTGSVIVITGTPSATPIAPQINPSSQIALTTITVKASSTLAPIITKIIYDEGTEWDTATSGTITASFGNEDNPYHGTKDVFVQTYENGGALEFTDSGIDTATSNMVLKYFLYLNSEFTNSFQVQFFNDSNPVSNSLSFNSGFGLNPNNVNVYQNISIPFTSFIFSSNIFNKVKITMAGEDLSGAAGYYLDYIQLQKGLSQTGSGSCPLCIVDIHVTADSTQQIGIRQNGDTAFVINWTGNGGSGITTEQISDSLGNITLQRAYNNAPTSIPQISNTTGFPINFRSGSISGLRSDLLLTGGGAELNSTYGTSFTGISNGIVGSRPTATTGVPAIELNAARTDNDTLPNSSIFLSISPDFIHIQNIVSPTKVVIQNADTLLTPPDYIWVDDKDTLKKAAYPAGGSTTFEQSLQNQGETAFSTDNTVDFGNNSFIENFSDSEGSTLSVQKNSSQIDTYVGNADKYGDIAITADGIQSVASSSDDSKQAGINLIADIDSSYVATYSIADGEGHRIDINPSVINIYPVNRPDLNLKIDGLDSSNAYANNIAWFDSNNILHRGAIFIDSTVTLSSGTITVSDTRVKTGARIFVSYNTPSGTQGFLSAPVGDIIDSTSFVINSSSAADNSTVNYQIINP